MTMPGWGYVLPRQIDMLRLAGHVLRRYSRQDSLVGTDEEKLASMHEGRESLVRSTEQDFGYDLREWYDHLMAQEDGSGLDFDGDHVITAIQAAFDDPDRIRLARILNEETSVDPQWLTSTVVALARGISKEHAFDRLPILADALQDAGCEDADFLAHCRGNHLHDEWCWVVKLLLGGGQRRHLFQPRQRRK